MPLPNAVEVDLASGAGVPETFSTRTASRISVDLSDAATGFTLLAPMSNNKVILVDDGGLAIHTWTSNRGTTGGLELLPDGTLLRSRAGTLGMGSGAHILDWDSTVIWDYNPPNPYGIHHDLEWMPNGNILMNAMVSYSDSQMVDLGRIPELTPLHLAVEPILEVKPSGKDDGTIVWMWNPLDHIIQDYASDKPNYGVIKDHPELIDLNFPKENPGEWQHSNTVSYNEELDQVTITNRNFSEFWIIDHNTTTAEAANHTGGGVGKGGDLLYRWGNPRAYGAGGIDDQVIEGPHDAHWIPRNYPGAGNIIIFNNGMDMDNNISDNGYSSVLELVLPLNPNGGYNLTAGSAYGPTKALWTYTASPPQDFYAWSMGGAERLPTGNTLICGGCTGYNFEVTPQGDVVWSYQTDEIFKISRYYPPYLGEVPKIKAIEDELMRVNVSSLLSDLDTDIDDLVISEDSPYATVSGHELLLQYPDGVTSDVINLTVADGIFDVSRDVLVNITPVNDPPMLGDFPEITATEDVPFQLSLKPYILDQDNAFDQLVIAVDSPFVTVTEGNLDFLYPDGILSDEINLTVSDGQLENRTIIWVNVTPVNDPPTADPIPVQLGSEDVPWTIDLGMYIRDVDNTLEEILVMSNSQYAKVSGMCLTFLYPENLTRDRVHLTVSDGQDSLVVTVDVIIEPVNDPPWIQALPTLTVTEDERSSIDLDPYLFDVDTPVDMLILNVASPFIRVDGHSLDILYPDGVQRDEVVVEVSDGSLLTRTTLVVVIEPVNDPPEIGVIPFALVVEDEPYSIDMTHVVSDIDTPMEELTLEVVSPYISVHGLVLTLLYPDGISTDGVVVYVTDGEQWADAILVVNVEPVNDPPWWSSLPEITAIEDEESRLNLELFMNDIDTPMSNLVVAVDSRYGSMEGHIFKYYYPDGVLSEEVTFTLSDGEFQVILRTVVTVYQVNDAPELFEAMVDPARGVVGKPVRFSVVYRDIDMGAEGPVVQVVIDDIIHACSSSGTDDGPYSEGVLFYFETKLAPGGHTFHFEADDGDGGIVTTEPLSIDVSKDRGRETEDNPGLISVALMAIAAATLVGVLFLRGRKPSDPSHN